ncbi:RlmE family RNA methyltransferase [Denitromonas ohlonensis]|uniref:Ribosomal RNA large subunit methyltransferase E n=2 Tax=Denitromonas TaxID=139331 RepID=A0A557SIR3_9RHOO|nr:SAM-dependent methyltransferase [Denitromonas ohlonensis]TVO69218.1 23S rRNA methyltransferase [Denitromonas ohlonensis]TVO77318.1 23S rRNA methyltransferase [Denitromonas ohlonensis]TVT50283.1 MAG: 23S rRNA methyltransferase [Denitromonas halophila]TVT78059.1 MAG: 23S rRNA methyltransferase [Denitromonas halophila]
MKRSKTSKAWMREHLNDTYVQQARAAGYRARAAYKLLEIDEKDKLIRPGMVVVDLGAAPGSWSQVAAQKVGDNGRVIALDLLEVLGMPRVTFIQGDFQDLAVLRQLEATLDGRPVDLVLSDMAPNVSGIGAADQARSIGLCELALDFAVQNLTPGGNFLVKVFQGSGFDAFRRAMQAAFRSVVVRKPAASRDRSSEVYLLGLGVKSAD